VGTAGKLMRTAEGERRTKGVAPKEERVNRKGKRYVRSKNRDSDRGGNNCLIEKAPRRGGKTLPKIGKVEPPRLRRSDRRVGLSRNTQRSQGDEGADARGE